MKRFGFFENFIFVCIVLVIVQTFLDDLSIILQWEVSYRNGLLVAGFVFDFIFTVEFVVRSIAALRHSHFKRYFFYERGWVDLLSSVPLLLLNSGPAVLLLFAGGSLSGLSIGFLNILKVIKAIRVTRILRLVRIIKIFGKIHNTESPMAQHHTAVVTTNAVFSIICVLIVFSLPVFNPVEKNLDAKIRSYERLIDSAAAINSSSVLSAAESASALFSNDPDVLRASYQGLPLVQSNEDYVNHFFSGDDTYTIEREGYSLLISVADIHAGAAMTQLMFFISILALVISISFLYSSHFAQNISDVLHIMNRGFRKSEYNLMVKIRPENADHEIFRLAKFYNDAYLPAKMRRADKSSKSQSPLSMDDFSNYKGSHKI